MTVEQLVGYTGNTNTFACITECLGTTDEQHVVIGIACHGGLIRRLERYAEVLTEIHGEVSQVFHHNHIILRSQFTDGLQFILIEADPRGIVGVTIYDSADVPFAEVRLQFRTEFVTTEIIYIERFVLATHDL